MPIGLFEDEQYEDCIIQLEPDSRMYLYSDGLLEAMNPQRVIFGESRLETSIVSTRQMDLQQSLTSIETSVSSWTETGQVHDDLSILALELTQVPHQGS